jgi:hypothetical protein
MTQPATPPAASTAPTKSAAPASGSVFDPLITRLASARTPHTAAQQALSQARQAWADALVAWGITPPAPVMRHPVPGRPATTTAASSTTPAPLPDLTAVGKVLVAAIQAEAQANTAVTTAQQAINVAMKAAGAA